MRITPLDIRKQEFKRGLRGYDSEEVQSFLQMVSTQWDELQAEHRRLEQKVSELEGKLQHYRSVEEALQEALRTARESSRQALETARQQGQTVLREAEQQAEQIRRGAEQESKSLSREAADARTRRNEILARLRAFLHSEMELLARFESDHATDSDAIGAVKTRTQTRARARADETEPTPVSQASVWPTPPSRPAIPPNSPFLHYGELPDEPHPIEPSRTASTGGEEIAPEWGRGEADDAVEPDDASSAGYAQPVPEPEPERDESRQNTGWVVRPVISAPSAAKPAADEAEEPPETDETQEEEDQKFNISASTDEIERIRRILKDLE